MREAARLGFRRVAVPLAQTGDADGAGMEVVGIESVREAFERLLMPAAGGGAGSPRPGGPVEAVKANA